MAHYILRHLESSLLLSFVKQQQVNRRAGKAKSSSSYCSGCLARQAIDLPDPREALQMWCAKFTCLPAERVQNLPGMAYFTNHSRKGTCEIKIRPKLGPVRNKTKRKLTSAKFNLTICEKGNIL